MGAAFSAGLHRRARDRRRCWPSPSRGALGFQLPLLVAAGFALASALARGPVRARDAAPRRRAGPQGATTGRACARPSRHPIIGRVVMISFIVVIGFAGIEATYGLWTEARFGWGPRQIGTGLHGGQHPGRLLPGLV